MGRKERDFKFKGKEKSAKEKSKDTREYIKSQQSLYERTKPEKSFLEYDIAEIGPFQIMYVSDIHWGSTNTDYDEIYKLMDYVLNTENVFVVFNGDLIEGVKPKYLDTNMDALLMNLNQQVTTVREEIIEPLVESGKAILGIGGHSSHDEWIKEYSQLSSAMVLFGGLDIKVLSNGGIAEFYLNDYDTTLNFKIFHNGPGGSSTEKPTAGLQKAADLGPTQVNVVAGGHFDWLSAATILVKDDGSLEYTVYIQTGAYKGTNLDNKDRHAEKKSLGSTAAKGGNAISILGIEDNGGPIVYPTITLKTAKIGVEAGKIMASLFKQGMVEEMLEMLQEEAGDGPRLELNEKKSKTTRKGFHGSEVYKDLVYLAEYSSNKMMLPISVLLMNELKLGGDDPAWELFEEKVVEVAGSSYKFMIFLREMLDPSLSTSSLRETEFEVLMNLVNELTNQDRVKIIGWLLDRTLQKRQWGKSRIRVGRGEYLDPNGFYPTDYISEAGINLVQDKATLRLLLPNSQHSMMIVDRNSGRSEDNPTYGLIKDEVKYLKDHKKDPHNIIVGGHHPRTGLTFSKNTSQNNLDQYFISPSLLNYEGEDFLQVQTVVIDPFSRTQWPTLTNAQADFILAAITLHSGFSQTKEGLEYWMDKIALKGGKRR